MTTTRRELFRLGLGGSTLLACGTTVPTFLARSALALADGPKREAGGPILVVIQLDGGNDGLNTVVPHGDDIYHRSRPKLALKAKDLKPIDDHIGLHPSLDGFAKLREDGRLAIVQSVGYPNPNRSHFESMAIWQTARLHPGQEEPGWLARAIDLGMKRRRAATHRVCISLRRRCRKPCAEESISFPRWQPPTSFAGAWVCLSPMGRMTSARHSTGSRDEARRARTRCSSSSHGTPSVPTPAAPGSTPYFEIGDGADDADSYALARRLRMIARMIKAGLSTSIYYTQLGGFDTHAEQLNQHSARLNRAKSLGRVVPGRHRAIRRWRPRDRADLFRVRPSPARKRQRRHRPRHGGAGVLDRPSRAGRLARTVPRPRRSQGRRPPARDRLPPNLRDRPRSVVEAARRWHARNAV